jgi:3-oxoacyl-[acyl-carrier protein] reductase
MMTLNGKVALVTGASRGIGAAIAKTLGRRGAYVVVNYLRSKEQANLVVKSIVDDGGAAELRQGDVTDESQMRLIVGDLQRTGKSIDILVNNAGAIRRPSGWLEQTTEQIQEALHMNFTAHLLLCRIVAPLMKEKRFGRIVNISSTYGLTGSTQVLAYTCAKSAIVTLTYALARELGPHGITVNCVAPGNINTDMTKSAPKEVVDWVISTTPVGRLGEPEEIAASVEFLVNSSFVNGAVLVVDGGQILNM